MRIGSHNWVQGNRRRLKNQGWLNLSKRAAIGLIFSFTVVAVLVRGAVLYFRWSADHLFFLASPLIGLFLAQIASKKLAKKKRVSKQLVYFVLLAGLCLRLAALVDDICDRPQQTSDWRKYEVLGERLATEQRYYDFTTPNGIELRAFRPPGLPFALAAGYHLFGAGFGPFAVMEAFSLLCLLSAFVIAKLWNNISAFVLFAYVALSPDMLYGASVTNSHLPALLIILLFALCAVSIDGRITKAAISGLIVGAGALIRAELMLLLIALVTYALLDGSSSLRNRFKLALVAGLAAFLPVLPWTARNCQVLGKCVLVSSNSGSVLYSANVTNDFRRGGGYNGIQKEFFYNHKPKNEVELDVLLRKEALRFIARNPDIYVLSMPFRISGFVSMQVWRISYSEKNSSHRWPRWFYLWMRVMQQVFLWSIYVYAGLRLMKIDVEACTSGLLLFYLTITTTYVLFFESLDRNHFPYVLVPLLVVSANEGQELAKRAGAGGVEP